MSSILDLTNAGLDDTFEPTTVKAGEEYELTIVSAISGEDKNGNAYIMPFFEVKGEPYCKEFGEYLPLPNASTMSEKELNKAKLKLTAFATAFGIDFGVEQDLDDWQGSEGWAILGMGKDQDGEPCNKVNKFVVSA